MLKEKKLLLESLKRRINSAPSLVLIDYGPMTAKASAALRRRLGHLAEMEIVPKRLFCKALNECSIPLTADLFPGHMAAVFVQEELSVIVKTLDECKKTNTGFRFLGSVIEGISYGETETIAIGKLPSREVVRAQLLGVLQAPSAKMLSVMHSALCSILHCIKAKARKSDGTS